MADFFARKNIKMQKGRAGLFFTFFLITAVVSFLFIGELLVYADDRITKEYDPDAYLQKNDTRLVVRYPDDKVLTEKDQAAISGVKYVDQVDLYDYANDVNYYIEKNKDYEIKYGSQDDQVTKVNEDGETDAERDQGVRLLDKTHFMKSSTAITKDDLSAGCLPKERNEIVLYSTDQKKLNSMIRCYFSSDNLWKEGQSCYQDLKVVGILKDKTRQVYFHPELCQMLTYGIDNFVVWGEYCWDMKYKKYFGTMKPAYVVVSDDLKDNEVRVSSNYIITSTGYGTVAVPDKLDRAFPGNGLLHIGHKDTESDSNSSQQEQIEQDLKAAGLEDTSEEAKKNDDSTTIEIKYVNDFSEQGGDFIEVSPEVYQKLRDVYNIGTTQASVYITNYSKTNKVIQALKEKGYDVISTYQVSTTKYVQEKVYKRLEVIGISCLILIVLAILQILIVRSILKMKKKDYNVLRFMGMKQKQLSRITYEEMGIHAAAAVVITLLIMFVLRQAGISFIQSMMFYYSVTGVLAYFLYNAVLLFATVFFFHRKLRYAEG